MQPEFSDLTVDELGHNKITADVYHSVAPTLHWNYYAKVGREHTFAEVREADLTSMAGAAGGLIMKYESKSLLVREPVGVVAALCRVQLPAAGHRPEDRAGDRGRVHGRGQGAGPGPADAVRHGRPGHRGRVPARRDQHRRRDARGVRAPGRPPGRRHGHVHRLDRGRQEDRRGLRRAGQALRARARRQVGGDHPRGRRPRHRRPDGRRASAPARRRARTARA